MKLNWLYIIAVFFLSACGEENIEYCEGQANISTISFSNSSLRIKVSDERFNNAEMYLLYFDGTNKGHLYTGGIEPVDGEYIIPFEKFNPVIGDIDSTNSRLVMNIITFDSLYMESKVDNKINYEKSRIGLNEIWDIKQGELIRQKKLGGKYYFVCD